MNNQNGARGGEVVDGGFTDWGTTVGDNREDASSMTNRLGGEPEHDKAGEQDTSDDSTTDEAMFTLSVSLDGGVSKPLAYHAWQVRTPFW